MKLQAFRIKNYRSIIDSEWNSLSPDNITALIGQNESGKTSVLEALKSFYDGIITDDILRSDLSMPEISCEFVISEQHLQEVLAKYNIPEVISTSLKETRRIILVRTWLSPKNNRIEISGTTISDYYKGLKESQEKADKELSTIFNQLDKEGTRLENITKQLNQEIASINKDYIQNEHAVLELQKKLNRTKSPEQKENFQSEIDKMHLALEHQRHTMDQKKHSIETLKEDYQKIFEKVRYVRNAKEALEKVAEAKKNSDYLFGRYQDLEDSFVRLSSPKEIRLCQQKLDVLRQQLFQSRQQSEKLKQDALFAKVIAAYIIEGNDYEEARKKAFQKLAVPNDHATCEDLGRAFFQYCPAFELFEDFSSLLPNRIDLDDLINENSSAEGYKAVQNFLVIAGVDPSFFQQQNNRILKQKIENLNGEITIDFQDFWRQNIGKNNKIKIHFDLEHYDFNHPEKRGKPYLEFWIKDSKERLYPKQRSRGVRWFLSFYLELKATAKLNQPNRVLLIDEPGVSLHTRAQEDVLKVFEDIKEELMILFTTHSPQLIDVNKLYRILAVQRAIEDDDSSESVIYDVRTLSKASADTLSPIYALMGARFSEQQFIQKSNNIIVEENSSYYLLTALFKLFYPDKQMYILPATDASNVPSLANLLMGWKLDFLVVLSGSSKGNAVYDTLKKVLFVGNEANCNSKVVRLDADKNLFDLFTTIDFKNHLLRQRVGITESNSEYIENNGLSAVLLAMEFLNQVQEGKVTPANMDEDSCESIRALLREIVERMQ